VLNGVDPLLTGDLLAALDAMGHGDTVVLADAHFPAARLGKRLVDTPAVSTPDLLRAVCSVLPLDDPSAVTMMATADGEPAAVQRALADVAGRPLSEVELLERFEFYRAAESAFVVVRTGETRSYGNVMLRKGLADGRRSRTDYLDYSGRDDTLSGGVRMIPVQTPRGTFRVWTKRVGNNPRLRMLLLHGGPGATHEYLEACDSYLPAAGVEYYYYDQLGSAWSDQPDEPSLWELDRFVDEVEQVRQALGLDRDDFVLYGQSWGGILAMEYALRHQEHLRALVISNMMADVPAYNAYAEQVLMPAMDQDALAEIKALEASGDIENPRYSELLNVHHNVQHVLRLPPEEWPNPVVRAFAAINPAIYVSMQGPSELGIAKDAKLAHWTRFDDLSQIRVPTLVIGARHDTMDPAHMEQMAQRLPAGQYLYCPDGSHLAMYDDQEVYFAGLADFLHGLDDPVSPPG
jgi:proline iminopeptidase